MLLNAFQYVAEQGEESRKDLLSDFQKASNYAGIAFGKAGCGAVHALSFPLSGRYHVTHGESNYQFFCQVLRVYAQKKPQGKMDTLCACIAQQLGCTKADAIEQLDTLLERIWHRKAEREFGMTQSDIPAFAQEVAQTLQPVLATSYVPLSVEELEQIYRVLY